MVDLHHQTIKDMKTEIQKVITKASKELAEAQRKFEKTNDTPEEMEVTRLRTLIYHLDKALHYSW